MSIVLSFSWFSSLTDMLNISKNSSKIKVNMVCGRLIDWWCPRYLNVGDHTIKIQTNCSGVIIPILRPGNPGVIENVLVVTCLIMTFNYENSVIVTIDQSNIYSSDLQSTPQVGDDIRAFASGKYLCINAAARRRDPVPERPWTVATWKFWKT